MCHEYMHNIFHLLFHIISFKGSPSKIDILVKDMGAICLHLPGNVLRKIKRALLRVVQTQKGSGTYELTVVVAECMRLVQAHARPNARMERRGGRAVSVLVREVLTADGCWEEEIQFALRVGFLVSWTTFQWKPTHLRI